MTNHSDQRIGTMIMDLSIEFEGYERRHHAQMEKLIAQFEELKQQLSQGKVVKGPMGTPIEFIVPLTSPLSASKKGSTLSLFFLFLFLFLFV